MKNWIINVLLLVVVCSFVSCEKIALFGNDEDVSDCSCESTTGTLLICENFESYSEGVLSPQSELWETPDRNHNDGRIFIDQSSEGLNALKLEYKTQFAKKETSALALGNYGCGIHRLTWKMYIPFEKNAIFRINKYAFETEESGAGVFFNSQGKGTVLLGGQAIYFDFYNDGWFKMELILDLDNDLQTITMNGEEISSWPYHYSMQSTTGTIRLSNILFEANTNGLFFIDEVCFEENIGENPYH